jgi:hypothetical protein
MSSAKKRIELKNQMVAFAKMAKLSVKEIKKSLDLSKLEGA